MKKFLIASLCLLTSSAFAATWDATYYNVKAGQFMIDSDSVTETGGGTTKLWTLFAPSIPFDQLGEGYAYRMVLHSINCKERTAAVTKTIYYDSDEIAHDAEVADKSYQEIVPGGESDYLWKYACQPESRKDLSMKVGGTKAFLAEQAHQTKLNEIQFKQKP
ncbi:surface-adhesin E family protein [Chromobacterium subtsugae]|uniref:surface-adhesin E family protein n=1 Tax=Chromobacterium subtsugae TaxID=251747 RepID=UPI000640EB28|nr:surface-adhesin E family protein [Chromobacterium subtsugae]